MDTSTACSDTLLVTNFCHTFTQGNICALLLAICLQEQHMHTGC